MSDRGLTVRAPTWIYFQVVIVGRVNRTQYKKPDIMHVRLFIWSARSD